MRSGAALVRCGLHSRSIALKCQRPRNGLARRTRYLTPCPAFSEIDGGNMELHQARYFLAVCNDLTFTRAAKKRNVAQPSLTHARQLLEQQVPGYLFERTR